MIVEELALFPMTPSGLGCYASPTALPLGVLTLLLRKAVLELLYQFLRFTRLN
jgi:hypothetical protein